jgi:hypothetical protein
MPATPIEENMAQTVIHEVLAGLIDYAGLFPPAGLAMSEATRFYQSYLGQRDRWILGRFICPVSRLGEWKSCVSGSSIPLQLSLLGGPAPPLERFTAHLERLVASARQELDEVSDHVDDRCWELRAPDLSTGSAESITMALKTFSAAIGTDSAFYVEVQPAPDSEALDVLFERLSELNCQREADAGFKLRCGGLEPAAFPSSEELARILTACHRHRVPLKLTAGLHHPLPSLRGGLPMHGFLNVLLAASALASYELRARDLIGLLEDRAPGNFRVTSDWIEWRELRISQSEMRDTRNHLIRSFGSCSFDEPREDLAQLGWFPPN